MIKLALTAAEADLLSSLLAKETERLVAEREMVDRTYPSEGRAKPLVLEAIDHDRKKVVNLREELLDAILCTLPDIP